MSGKRNCWGDTCEQKPAVWAKRMAQAAVDTLERDRPNCLAALSFLTRAERAHGGAGGSEEGITANLLHRGFHGMLAKCIVEQGAGLGDDRSHGAQKYNQGVPLTRAEHDVVEVSEQQADEAFFAADQLLKKAHPNSRECLEAFTHIVNGALDAGITEADNGYVVPVGLEQHLGHTAETFRAKCLVKRRK